MVTKETLIYSNQHQSLRLYMLIFRGFLALPLTGESFNQCFPKETLIYSIQHQSLRLYMLIFRGFLALPLAGESFNQCFPKHETYLFSMFSTQVW